MVDMVNILELDIIIDYKTAYAHLSNYKKGISQGVRVNQGDIIGYVGSTGDLQVHIYIMKYYLRINK